MPRYLFEETTTGQLVLHEATPPFDAASVPGLDGTYRVSEVSAAATQTVAVSNVAELVVGYDFRSATPFENTGSTGAANDLLVTGAAVPNTTDGLVTGPTQYDADTQYQLPLNTSFTFFMDVTFDTLNNGDGINLISSTIGDGSNANGTLATFIRNNEFYLFPKTTGDTPLPAFSPAINTPYKIAMTYNWDTRVFATYVNGVANGSYTRGEQITVGANLFVGKLVGATLNRNANGFIRSVGIYSRVLNLQEIQSL